MISILYVDDESDLLTIARVFLEKTGEFQVVTMSSAREALSSPLLPLSDAIVSDYQMPGMNGIEFLKKVREEHNDIPFILFTGRGREEVAIDAINNGADFYLQKGGDPTVQFAELIHKIRQVVRRKQAERSLEESKKQLSDIFDFLPDPTFAIDQTGTVIAWNRAIEEMTGVPASDMLGKGNYAYAFPFYGEYRPALVNLIQESDEKIAPHYTHISRSGNTITAETDLAHPRGHQISALVKVSPLYNQEGEVVGGIESIRDISESKRIEQELRHSEERYRSIVNDQTEMIMRFTPEGTISFTNRAFRQFFLPMLENDEIEGMNIANLTMYATDFSLDTLILPITPSSPIIEMEQEFIDPVGMQHWQMWVIRAFYDSSDKPIEYQVVGRDITRQKQSEKELAESEEQLRSFIETTRDSFVIIDEEGIVIEWNPGAEQISGLSKKDVLGIYVWDVTYQMMIPERQLQIDRNSLEEKFRSMLKTGIPIFEGPRIFETIRPDGSRVRIRQIIYPIKTRKGFRYYSVSHDITDEKKGGEDNI